MRDKSAKECGDDHVLKGREPVQMGWYEYVNTHLAPGKSVLDVGCGSCEGLRLLVSKARMAVGIDLDPRLAQPDLDVRIVDITQIPDKSFDVVVCIDVIEHIENDRVFLKHLMRVARETIFLSTPNYSLSRNMHPYHVREYTPREFDGLLEGVGHVKILGGSYTGEEREEIRRPGVYRWLNDLYAKQGTVVLGKILRRILFERIWAHQAAVISLERGVDVGDTICA
jgi:SAM-dependent methyltransferase